MVNGKIYIGVHKTDNVNKFDGYYGCGMYNENSQPDITTGFPAALRKYGKENFVRETLFIYPYTEQGELDAFNKEAELVNEEFVKRKDTYNLRLGGKFVSNEFAKKPIAQYSIEGKFIKKWDSITKAEEALGLTAIGAAINGISKYCGDYQWREYTDENDIEANNVGKFFLCFGIVDQNGNIYDNLPKDSNELKNNYTNLITLSKTNYKLQLIYQTEVYRVGTAAIMEIDIPNDAELQDEITFSYNNKQFMTLKYGHQDQENTIIARAKWDGQTISIIHHLYFLTAKNPNKEIGYESHVLNAPMSLDNIIFLIDNKYQINADNKILRNVLTQYNLEYEHDSGYDFNSYMDYYVMDISDCINDVYRNYVYLKDIEDGDPFANFKIYIYTRNNQSEYVYLGYIATVEPYNDAYETFIGFFDKKIITYNYVI